MVYDWFTRSGAPENGDSPEPTEQPDAPVAAEAAPAAPVADSGVDQDALEWARQAYARLKAQQEAEKQQAAPEPSAPPTTAAVEPPVTVPEPELEPAAQPEPAAAPPAGLSLLEQAAAQRAQRQQELLERAIDTPPAPVPALSLIHI